MRRRSISNYSMTDGIEFLKAKTATQGTRQAVLSALRRSAIALRNWTQKKNSAKFFQTEMTTKRSDAVLFSSIGSYLDEFSKYDLTEPETTNGCRLVEIRNDRFHAERNTSNFAAMQRDLFCVDKCKEYPKKEAETKTRRTSEIGIITDRIHLENYYKPVQNFNVKDFRATIPSFSGDKSGKVTFETPRDDFEHLDSCRSYARYSKVPVVKTLRLSRLFRKRSSFPGSATVARSDEDLSGRIQDKTDVRCHSLFELRLDTTMSDDATQPNACLKISDRRQVCSHDFSK